MKKIILTERELVKVIKRIISEDSVMGVTMDDYNFAVSIARDIEEWWRSTKREKFFETFQGFLNDEDDDAATEYDEKILNTYREQMKRILTNGQNNKYYKELDNWFKEIVDQIDDSFQSLCPITLYSPQGTWLKFTVDPEID